MSHDLSSGLGNYNGYAGASNPPLSLGSSQGAEAAGGLDPEVAAFAQAFFNSQDWGDPQREADLEENLLQFFSAAPLPSSSTYIPRTAKNISKTPKETQPSSSTYVPRTAKNISKTPEELPQEETSSSEESESEDGSWIEETSQAESSGSEDRFVGPKRTPLSQPKDTIYKKSSSTALPEGRKYLVGAVSTYINELIEQAIIKGREEGRRVDHTILLNSINEGVSTRFAGQGSFHYTLEALRDRVKNVVQQRKLSKKRVSCVAADLPPNASDEVKQAIKILESHPQRDEYRHLKQFV